MKAALTSLHSVGQSAIDVKCHLKLVVLPARKSVSVCSSCSAAFCFRFGTHASGSALHRWNPSIGASVVSAEASRRFHSLKSPGGLLFFSFLFFPSVAFA